MPKNILHYYLLMIYYTVRNKLFPIYTGPSSVRYIGSEEKVPKVLRRPDDKRTVVRVNYERSMTIGKVYQSERQDRISYYLKDDRGDLCEVSKSMFEDITETRNKLLKKIGI